MEAAINEKQPNLCSSLIKRITCISPFGALNHTYPELSVAIATLVSLILLFKVSYALKVEVLQVVKVLIVLKVSKEYQEIMQKGKNPT